MAVRSFLLLAFAFCVLTKTEGLVFEPCFKTDVACLRKSLMNFFENTSNGLPQYDMKPLDPLIIPELNVYIDEYVLGLEFRFKNLHVTGLKKFNVSNIEFNTYSKTMFLQTRGDINISGDLTVVLFKNNKKFTGSYTASATTVLGNTNSGYTLIKKGGEEFFELGYDRHACEVNGEINVAIDSNLQNALENDPDAISLKPGYEARLREFRDKAICNIMQAAFKTTLVHNIRAAGRSFPKTTFFKD